MKSVIAESAELEVAAVGTAPFTRLDVIRRGRSEWVPAVLKNSYIRQAILLEVYRRDPACTMVCERLVDLDEGMQEWRYRHVKMVERTIGNKQGTGGSLGVEFLRRSLFQPLFPDLWAVRHRF